jgi:hypothetical protein
MNPARYREYAEECRNLAKTANPEHKKTLLEIAAAWERCANEAQQLTEPQTVSKGSGESLPS